MSKVVRSDRRARGASSPRATKAALGAGVACLLLTSGLAACTSSSSGGTSSGSKTVTIGLSVSKTGQNGKTGQQVLDGYQLWADDVNKKGGLRGRQVSLKVYDDKSDPSTGVSLYTKLITQDHVDLVIGPFGSSVAEPVAAVTERYKYPMVAGGSSASSIWEHGYHYVFGVYPSGTAQDVALLDVADQLNVKTIAVVNEASPFGRDTADGIKALAPKHNMKVVYHQEFPVNATDFSGVVAKLGGVNADFLVAGTYYDESTLLAKQLHSAAVKFPVFTETIGPEGIDFVKSVGAAAEGLLGAAPWAPGANTPGSAQFLREFKAKYHVDPIYQAAMAYAAGQILEHAVSQAGSLDRTAIRDALANEKLETISGKYQVDSRGFQVGATDFITQVQDGKPVVIYPEEYAEAQAHRIS
jgi:branched-chain amino acid transport system substrate-binding protein